ncbi:hypothetical protein FRC06_002515, partial [Ceratobasidium sp. 370]
MSAATKTVMPRSRANGSPPRAAWWTSECSQVLKEVKANEDDETGRRLHAEMRAAVRRAKRSAASRICEEVTVNNLFKLTGWYAARTFQKQFFPQAPPPVDASDNMGIPERETRDHHSITESEVKSALDSSSNTSAPGAFGSNYRVLKWAFECKPDAILELYNACLRLGYHPECLRNAIASIIPKPRRPDMSRPNAYRPISLLETLSKCLEKVMTTRILHEVGKHGLVPFAQFGGRDASSCTDAGLAMVHDIQSTWKNQRKASLLTLDISGYFNNINHERLLATMTRLGFSNELIRWLRSYLTGRTVQIKFDEFLSDPIPIASVGVPQGSPLSPILSTIYTLPLLLALHDRPSFLIKGYVDDFTILAISDSFAANNRILNSAVEEASAWLSRLGLAFELEKCELIHFASSARDMPSNPDLHLDITDSVSGIVRAANVIRWLGFFLDRRLNFKDHVGKMATKGMGVIAGLRLLANSVRGLSTKHARLLYKACVMPVLTYGSAIWYSGARQSTLIKNLERVQNAGLRWLLGAFRTSPTNAMEHLASILPMHVALHRLSENYATRLRKIPISSEVARRLPVAWDTHDPTTPQPRRPRASKPTVIHRLAEQAHPNIEHIQPYLDAPWERPHPFGNRIAVTCPPASCTRDERKAYVRQVQERIWVLDRTPGALACFTDGSKRIVKGCRKVGAGFCILRQGKEIRTGRQSLGPRSDIFDAEMFALALAAKQACALAAESNIPSVDFFTDNRAALTSIVNLRPHPAQAASVIFRGAVDYFLHGDTGRSVQIHWVPSHTGIHGNERADELATEAGALEPTPYFNRTITWARARAKERAMKTWTRQWSTSRHSNTVLHTLPYPPRWKLHPAHDNFPSSRAVHARLNQ